MTLIRRPGRISGLHIFESDVEEQAETRLPTTETVLRAKLVSAYMHGAYSRLFDETSKRQMHSESRTGAAHTFRYFKTGPDSYHLIELLGKGGCGEVWLAEDVRLHQIVAIKRIDQRKILVREQLPKLHIEQQVMSEIDSPWIVSLQESFCDDRFLYFVMEYIPGGDLMNALMRQYKFSETTTRFFIAEIAMAIHALHTHGYIHRDIKPDNIMLCEDGHIKLTDFGLSVQVEKQPIEAALQEMSEYLYDQISTGYNRKVHLYGTCDYISPEAVTTCQATYADDFWALGVIMYEMLAGFNPFIGKTHNETLYKVRNWQHVVDYSKAPLSPEAQDLLQHLICASQDRYTYDQIIQHPFFTGFDFDYWRSNIPPMVPCLVSPRDTSHFDKTTPDTTSTMSSSFDNFLLCDLVRLTFSGFRYRKRDL